MLFIHQFPDWTHFRFDSRRVLDALGKARYTEGRLSGLLAFADSKELETGIVVEDIVASYAIDGITLVNKGQDGTGAFNDYVVDLGNSTEAVSAVITRKAITVTASADDSESIVYGNDVTIVYDADLAEGDQVGTDARINGATSTSGFYVAGVHSISKGAFSIVDANDDDVTDNYDITYVAGKLTIETGKDDTPGTGDTRKTLLWAGLMLTSALGCAGALLLAKRKKQEA